MWYTSILIILTLSLVLWLKKIFDQSLRKEEDNCKLLLEAYDSLISQGRKLKNDNSALDRTVEDTIALYDITKEICKSLEEDKVFTNFREVLIRYIKVNDCKLLKEPPELPQEDYTVLPLNIESDTVRYLAVSRIKEQDSDKLHILSQQFLLGIKRAVFYQKIQELAITDSLTGVSNRRYLLTRFNEEVERSKKFKYNFAFFMADIDHFKNYNDRYGHLVGDVVLKEVCKVIKGNIRQIDLAGRYGGEEFSIILTETGREEAELAAERIRLAVERRRVSAYDEHLKVTISIGISIFPDDASEAGKIIECADQALYQAKQRGRNRVCMWEKP